uniref:Dihydrolipoamide acetyltransferase component of pyruvate dehydrogenase complex n=1 Tax=Plectus sambesii TaxID=2011161 RepID=A0A914VJG0_9BILA
MSSLISRRLIGGVFRFGHLRSLHSSSVWSGKVVQFKLSDIGEGIAEVQLKEWHVKTGDRVSQFDNLCDVQSDKASVTITSRYDGVIKRLYYKVDDVAPVGKALVDIELEGEGEDSAESVDDDKSAQSAAADKSKKADGGKSSDEHETSSSFALHSGKVLATPAVRRIAMENKIKLGEVSGSGKNGRVMKEDVLRFLGHIGPAETTSKASDQSRPAFAPLSGQDKTIPIRGYTRIMMKTMTQANTIPHFGYNDEVVVNRLIDLRAQLKKLASEKGTKMSYMPLFIKAASLALTQYPVLNASLDSSLENITYKSAHNICVAMDTPGGLVVPNIKHCEQRNLWEIALELNRLQEAGKRQQLDRNDLADGTFTLSNIGAIGGTYASPVIFPPQVAIGALGKIEVHPRYDHHMQIYPAHLVKVSWAADHRVIDGATMARFSNVWKEYLENPALMIAEMR